MGNGCYNWPSNWGLPSTGISQKIISLNNLDYFSPFMSLIYYQPVKQYPHLFHEKSVFGRYAFGLKLNYFNTKIEWFFFYFCLLDPTPCRFPYLLPCLFISFFATLVFISCAWLPVSTTLLWLCMFFLIYLFYYYCEEFFMFFMIYSHIICLLRRPKYYPILP